jgi:hypothetical protein
MDSSSGVPAPNVTVAPRELHMEIFDSRTADVWLCQRPVTAAEYQALQPEPPYVKSGLARSAMDFAWFLRSPGALADGPLESRIIGGLPMVRVARPLDFRGFAAGDAPTRLTIDKHHLIGFNAGTRARLVQLPDGAFFVQQTVSAGPVSIPLPADWKAFELRSEARWSVCLGAPVTVYFFRNLSSFQGPLTREQLPGEPKPCVEAEPV